MPLCLFEDAAVSHLRPLVYTRAAYDLRVGMRTLLQRTCDLLDHPRLLLHARPSVAAVTGEAHEALVNRIPEGLDVLFVNGRLLLQEGDVLSAIQDATTHTDAGRCFLQGDTVVAAWVPDAGAARVNGAALTADTFADLPTEQTEGATFIHRVWDLVAHLRPALAEDIQAAAKGYNVFERPNTTIHESATLAHSEQVIVAPGASIHPGAILNAADGPIFIGPHAQVWEGAVVKGPAYVRQHAHVKAQAYVEGSAIGPWSKVGGEVHTSTLHSFSNKGHAGFLGHSYLGRWCNLGADTNTSNLKNDYGEVSLYQYEAEAFVPTGRQFLGLLMGDHSKCGINTMFNTGTVVGVACNLYGAGFLPRFIPSFSWGGPQDGLTDYRLEKMLRVAETVMARRDTSLSDAGRELLSGLFGATAPLRVEHHG